MPVRRPSVPRVTERSSHCRQKQETQERGRVDFVFSPSSSSLYQSILLPLFAPPSPDKSAIAEYGAIPGSAKKHPVVFCLMVRVGAPLQRSGL